MWRYTANPVQLAMLDARACLPLLAVVVYWSWTTLAIAVVGTLFFGAISYFGLTVPAFGRALRRRLVGSVRPAVPAWRRRRLA